MPEGVRMRISSLLATIDLPAFSPWKCRQIPLTALGCNRYTRGIMDGLVSDAKLSVVAYGAVLDMIARGTIAAGELVTERQIAARLGMSRTPVREAVRRLEGEGTLERQRNGALVVRPHSMEDFLHALAVRRLLEGEAARLAAGKASTEFLGAARERIAQIGRASCRE